MNGWTVRLKLRLKGLLMLLLVSIGMYTHADEQQPQDAPTEEMLEFLAAWETRDGEWLGPESVSQMPEVEESKAQDENDAK